MNLVIAQSLVFLRTVAMSNRSVLSAEEAPEKKSIYLYKNKSLEEVYAPVNIVIPGTIYLICIAVAAFDPSVDFPDPRQLNTDPSLIGTVFAPYEWLYWLILYMVLRLFYKPVKEREISGHLKQFGDYLSFSSATNIVISKTNVQTSIDRSGGVDAFIKQKKKSQEQQKKKAEKKKENDRRLKKAKTKGKQKLVFDVTFSHGVNDKADKARLEWVEVWDYEATGEKERWTGNKKVITSAEDMTLTVGKNTFKIVDFDEWSFDFSGKKVERAYSKKTSYVALSNSSSAAKGLRYSTAVPFTSIKPEQGQNLLNISLGKGEEVTLILSTGVSYGRWADDYNQHRIRSILFFLNNYFTVKIFKTDFQSQLTGMKSEDVKSEFIRNQIDKTKSILVENSDSQAHKEILEYLLQERKKLNG